MNQSKLRGIIIDDSEGAVLNLLKTIDHFFHSEVEIIATFTNAVNSISRILDMKPDLIFLDIEMQEMDGFQVYDIIPEEFRKRIIIYSGVDSYGVKVINNMSVVGFISKPIIIADLRKCINKIKLNQISNIRISKKEKEYEKQILLNGQNKTIIVKVESIVRLESEGPYTNVYFDNKVEKTSKHLKLYMDLLSPYMFIRVDRSNLVNISCLVEVNKLNYTNELKITDGHVIKLSKEKLSRFMLILNKTLSCNLEYYEPFDY